MRGKHTKPTKSITMVMTGIIVILLIAVSATVYANNSGSEPNKESTTSSTMTEAEKVRESHKHESSTEDSTSSKNTGSSSKDKVDNASVETSHKNLANMDNEETYEVLDDPISYIEWSINNNEYNTSEAIVSIMIVEFFKGNTDFIKELDTNNSWLSYSESNDDQYVTDTFQVINNVGYFDKLRVNSTDQDGAKEFADSYFSNNVNTEVYVSDDYTSGEIYISANSLEELSAQLKESMEITYGTIDDWSTDNIDESLSSLSLMVYPYKVSVLDPDSNNEDIELTYVNGELTYDPDSIIDSNQ